MSMGFRLASVKDLITRIEDREMGEWEKEPDEMSFTDETTSFPITLKRHSSSKHWCAYIGVPIDHPWQGKEYSAPVLAPEALTENTINVDEIGAINLLCASASSNPDQNIYPIDVLVRCHGGLTFSGKAYWEESRADWWFGFDCAHDGDLVPGHPYAHDRDVYRNLDYVKECAIKAAGDIALAMVTE